MPKDKDHKKSTVLAEDAVHYPSTSSYSIKRMYDDLLNFSAKHLKLGGRLVCWFPVARDDYSEDLLPQHSALQLVENSEQKLTADATRRLLTYEKVEELGEIIDVTALQDFDFRRKYFTETDAEKQKARIEAHRRNMNEALKRGKVFENKSEMKKIANKKFILEREKTDNE